MSQNETTRVNISINEDEHNYIKFRAVENGMSVSEYIRFCCLYEGVTAGDKNALAIMGHRFTKHTINTVKNWAKAFKKGGGNELLKS